MIAAARRSYGYARVRARRARLLGPDRLMALARADALGAAVPGWHDSSDGENGSAVVSLVYARLIDDYAVLMRAYPEARTLLSALVQVHEIENVKLLWRAVVRRLPAGRWRAAWRPLGALESFGVDRSMSVTSLPELAAVVASTPYREIVAAESRAHPHDLPAVEIALDRSASARIMAAAAALAPREETARELAIREIHLRRPGAGRPGPAGPRHRRAMCGARGCRAERGVTATAGLEYLGLRSLRGPLAFIDAVPGLSFHEQVELAAPDGSVRAGRVLGVSDRAAVIEVFGPTDGLTLAHVRLRFEGRPFRFGVGRELLGRAFDGVGRPRDGLPPPLVDDERPVEGAAINPCRREYPRDFLETGVSAIDLLTSVVLGQKLPIFTEAGLPHDALALQIIRQARATALEYEDAFRSSRALGRMVAFMNLADDPPAERPITPRCALTVAEYLAFDCGMHVLVVLHDIANYGESLREVSAARGEVPSRKGYPGYLYSDLASMFERAGRIKGRPGSITQIPIVTMPSGDVTHPIPDLTGYVTEGQIVLDRALDRRAVYPPIAVLPSLSRLMSDGIGAGRTREDHADVARQVYAACARVVAARSLASIIGRDELSDVERRYLEFGDRFETVFLRQGRDEARPIAETLTIAWRLLAELPRSELTRLAPAMVERYLPPPDGGAAR